MRRELQIAKEHPAYEGHFPGHPLLPGVVLVAEAMAALGASHWTVVSAKFLSPVEPGMALTLEPRGEGPAHDRFRDRIAARHRGDRHPIES
jgi:3-hydroxymyristoyl/3-hydroxydecanoyl-(acyl carrier protein) dehydratase